MFTQRFLPLLYLSLLLSPSVYLQAAPIDSAQSIVHSVDPTQLVGTWYEIARLDNVTETGLEQVTLQYSLQADGTLQVLNRGVHMETNNWQEIRGQISFIDPRNADGSRSGRLLVSYADTVATEEYHLIDIDQPYYNYALLSSGRDHLWILSRTPQLTYPIKQHLMAKAKALGFATDQLLFVRQANQVEYESGRHVMPEHH